jgi:4-hydroxybenzoate polyprenyltransferase
VTDLIQSIRPKQWAKNIIVFAALFFSKNCFAAIPLFKTLATFVLFCGLSSAVYLLNDCLDIERDRLHPVKAKRPIASGRVAIGTAITFAVVLAVASLAGSFLLQPKLMVDLNPSISSDQNSALLFPSFFVVASSYLVLFVLYSVVLKNILMALHLYDFPFSLSGALQEAK